MRVSRHGDGTVTPLYLSRHRSLTGPTTSLTSPTLSSVSSEMSLSPMTKIDTNGHGNANLAARDGTESGTVAARKRGRRTEAQRTGELMVTLPEGIQIGRWSDPLRKKVFFVRWGKDRKVESFESEGDRNDAAEKLSENRETDGSAVLEFDPQAWREWKAFRQRCPAPYHELEAAWIAHGGASKRIIVITKDAAERYLALRLSEDIEKDSDTHRHVKLHLKRLCDAYGDLPLDSVTPDMIRDLMEKIVSKKTGNKLGKLAKRHHRKDWNTFFKRSIAEEWMGSRKNPCSAVKPPRVDPKDKTPLSARAVFDLLKFNHDEPVIGRIVLELYGFLRAASAERLKKEHLRFDAKGIRLPGARVDEETGETKKNHKSGKTKYRQGHAPVLWDWLTHAPEACWTSINEGNYGHKKGAAFLRAHVVNPRNGLRDSCISYHLGGFKNPPLTTYLAQHRHMSMTETYEGIVDDNDAKLVMAMTPENVLLTWEEFITKVQSAKP